MTDTRADLWNGLLSLLTAATAVSIFPYTAVGLPELWIEYERNVLYALVLVVTIAHLHYGQGVVREMCSHFRIRCFKVRPTMTHASLDTNKNGNHSNHNPAENGHPDRKKRP